MMTVISPSHPLSDHTEAVRSVLVFTFKEIFFPIVTKVQTNLSEIDTHRVRSKQNFFDSDRVIVTERTISYMY